MSDLDDADEWRELRIDLQWQEFSQGIFDQRFAVHRTRLSDVVKCWPMDNDLRAIRCPDHHRGVYAFRDPSGDGEFLWVGKSDEGHESRDIKVRIGQHLTPKDQGGSLRQNWCSEKCQDEVCGSKVSCGGSDGTRIGRAFEEFEQRMLGCEVWTITRPSDDIGPMADLEDRLTDLANPTYKKD